MEAEDCLGIQEKLPVIQLVGIIEEGTHRCGMGCFRLKTVVAAGQYGVRRFGRAQMCKSMWAAWEGRGPGPVQTICQSTCTRDLVNPGGRKPDWSLREGREAGHSVLDCSMGGGSGQPTGYATNLRRDIWAGNKDL